MRLPAEILDSRGRHLAGEERVKVSFFMDHRGPQLLAPDGEPFRRAVRGFLNGGRVIAYDEWERPLLERK